MAAFQFPDPADTQTVVNPITGSTYQWKEPPGKWVVTTKMRGVSDIIYEGDNPPNPIGDYKLWYSTDTLELYFHYCDANGVCAWVPTSAPITMLEDLDAGLAEVKANVVAINQAVNTNENRIETIIAFSETAPPTYPDAITPVVDDEGNPLLDENGEQVVTYTPDPANHKFWLKTSTNELHILRLQDEDLRTYDYELIAGVAEVPDLEAVLNAGNIADKSIVLTNGTDDALLLSPEEGRIMIGGKDDVVPKLELRHTTGVLDTSLVAIELDEDGKRFDIECDERVDNIHFRFNNDDKLVLNKEGDAVFEGGVQVKDSLKSNGFTNQGNATLKFGSGQGIVIDSGSSFEPMLGLRSYSGPNQRKDVLIVHANGNAELLGKLTLAPGTSGNQAVTYNQLLEIEEEIESIIPSIERGQFEWTLDEITTSTNGKYNLLRPFTEDESKASNAVCMQEYTDCIFSEFPENCDQKLQRCVGEIPQIDEPVPDNEFAIATHIRFSKKDIGGTQHTWSNVKVGQIIDVFNQDDDGYMVAEITEITKDSNDITTFALDVIQSKGKASGNCRIKIFEVNFDNVEVGDFVRKSGDTLTGKLILKQPSSSVDMLSLRTKNDADFFNLGSDNDTLAKLALANNKEFKIGTSSRQIFKIYADSTCALGGLKDVNENTGLDAAVNKKYVDSRRLWRWTGDQTTSPPQGHFSFASSGAGSLYFHPIPEVGTRLKCSGNKYLCKGGDSLDQDKEFGYVPFTIWAWESDHWEPAMSGHITYSGMRTGKNDEPWRFTSNKNTIIVLEGLTKDKLYNITVAGTILA